MSDKKTLYEMVMKHVYIKSSKQANETYKLMRASNNNKGLTNLQVLIKELYYVWTNTGSCLGDCLIEYNEYPKVLSAYCPKCYLPITINSCYVANGNRSIVCYKCESKISISKIINDRREDLKRDQENRNIIQEFDLFIDKNKRDSNNKIKHLRNKARVLKISSHALYIASFISLIAIFFIMGGF